MKGHQWFAAISHNRMVDKMPDSNDALSQFFSRTGLTSDNHSLIRCTDIDTVVVEKAVAFDRIYEGRLR